MLVDGIIVSGPYEASLSRLQLPEPGETDVVVCVHFCGLCTWEQRVFRGTRRTYPFWGGHELCGVVESIGRDAKTRCRPGDLVAVALMDRCGKCRHCLRGFDNHCAYLHPRPDDGLPSGPRGLSTFVVVSANKAIPVDRGLGLRAALLEPLACTLRSIRRSQVRAGQLAVVIGTGTLGLLHAAALHAKGVQVLACDPGQPAVEQLAKTRLQEALSGDTEQIVSRLHQGGGADCVFCVRGGVPWINAAMAMCARGGTVVLFQSIPGSDVASVSMNDLHQREISVVGTVSQRLEDFVEAAELAARHPWLFDPLTTVTVSHLDPGAAFQTSLDSATNRVLVKFRD